MIYINYEGSLKGLDLTKGRVEIYHVEMLSFNKQEEIARQLQGYSGVVILHTDSRSSIKESLLKVATEIKED